MFRNANLAYITDTPSHHGEDIQYSFKEYLPGIISFQNLGKDFPVF